MTLATTSKGRSIMLHKLRIALAATIVALAAVSAADSASALGGHDFSFLSTYRVTTDEAGDVASYERVRRYDRSSATGVGP
jgi:Gas vesicle synthesis protein GvpO